VFLFALPQIYLFWRFRFAAKPLSWWLLLRKFFSFPMAIPSAVVFPVSVLFRLLLAVVPFRGSFSDGCSSAAAAFVAFWCYAARWYCYGGGFVLWFSGRCSGFVFWFRCYAARCSGFPAVQISLLQVSF
jgi:hypothetical protein